MRDVIRLSKDSEKTKGNRKNIIVRLICGAIWAVSISDIVQAQTPPPFPVAQRNDQQDQLIQQQQQAKARQKTIDAPTVRADVKRNADYPVLPSETPCFVIDAFTLDVPATLSEAVRAQGASALPMDRFAFAASWLRHYAGQCIGRQGLDLIVKGLGEAILDRGWVTTRVLLPEQDLTSRRLTLALVPGIIHHIRFADPHTRDTWRSAFPTGDGDLLNLRDLEQGLEQMKRVASQDVTMQIIPAEAPGESDVVIDVKHRRPYTFAASIDDAGTKATGKIEGALTLGIDNLLGLQDVMSVGVTQDLQLGDKGVGSHGWNGSYSLPWGYWKATLAGYTNTYYQQIAGVNQTFVASGNSQTIGLKVQRVLYRSSSDVTGVTLQLSKRFGASFIADTEIAAQRRDNTLIEGGLTDRHYFGASQFDGTLVYRQGIGWLGATPDTAAEQGGPTYRLHMGVLDANLQIPFALGSQVLRFQTTFHGQYTHDILNYVDDIAIGSRYTVRGFDGETMIAAESGFYWRNELQAVIGRTGQAVYAGLDYGHLWGASAAYQAGTQLAGAVVGWRGNLSARPGTLSYDLFVGTPVYKPRQYHTAGLTGGFQLVAQF